MAFLRSECCKAPKAVSSRGVARVAALLGHRDRRIFSPMRIASLLPSATEMVYALELGDRLVAISHECDYPPEALSRPRVSRPRFDPAGLSSGAIDAAVRASMASHGAVYQLDEDGLRAARQGGEGPPGGGRRSAGARIGRSYRGRHLRIHPRRGDRGRRSERGERL